MMIDLSVQDRDATEAAPRCDRDGTSRVPETIAYRGSVWQTTMAGERPAPRVTLLDDGPAEPTVARPDRSVGGAGRYQLLGEIARGGMGAVLRGRDPDLNRDLAVKVLLDHHRDQPDVLRRFFEEAQIGGQLQHPGIVPVYEVGTFPDKRPFFAMKLVKGRTLAALLQERATPADALPRFLGIFEQVAQTVAYAHSKGVIHRDLKPQNIMVGAFGEVQVMDWGLAKVLGAEGHDQERPPEAEMTLIRTVRSDSNVDASVAGSVMGTPAYMSPEQARGEIYRVDERADVFGLGSILCEILTGRPAYVGRHAVEVLRKAELGDLLDARTRLDACGADAELIALAKSCLAAEPCDRPREAGAVALAVTDHVSGVADRLRASELARVEAAAQARAERMRRRFNATLTAVALLAVAIVGGAWITFRTIRVAQLAETDRTVGAALTCAETLLAEARRDGAGDLDTWTRALSAADRAHDVLSGRDARPELSARVDVLLVTARREAAEVRARAERVVKGRALLESLEEARLKDAALRDEDLDVSDAIRAFRGSRSATEPHRPEELAAFAAAADPNDKERIAAVLDDWARLEADGPRKDRLIAMARTVDPDPYRDRLRGAMTSRDHAALSALARDAAAEALPPSSLVLLANALAEDGARLEALSLLIRAQRRHPGHFWVNQALGRSFGAVSPRRWDEAARYFTAAVALRPASPGARFHLGLALHHLGRPDEAAAALREAARLRQDQHPPTNTPGVTETGNLPPEGRGRPQK